MPRRPESPSRPAAAAAPKAEPAPAPAPAPVAAPAPPATDGADGRVKASPVARRMARELGIELGGLRGSGPGGRIVKADIEAAAAGGTERAETGAAPALVAPAEPAARSTAAPAPSEPLATTASATKGEVKAFELSKLQQTVARRMAESAATAPHFYLQAQIEMADAAALRAQLKQLAPEGAPSINDMVVKATALALRSHPRANGAYRDGQVEHYGRINVGVAVAAREALVVPTVFDADTKSLGEIARETKALAARTREGTITPPELSGGTFTVSNLGMYGIENFGPVINPPQAGILAVGAMEQRAVVDEAGQVVARETMAVTLACDHRILYGAEAATFLGRVRELLEAPVALTL